MRTVVSLGTNLSEHLPDYLKFGDLCLLGANFARLGPVEEAPHFYELTATATQTGCWVTKSRQQDHRY
jgi:hypothetical protein